MMRIDLYDDDYFFFKALLISSCSTTHERKCLYNLRKLSFRVYYLSKVRYF